MEKRFFIDLIYRHYLLEARFNALVNHLKTKNPELLESYNDPKVLENCIECARIKVEEILKTFKDKE